MSEFDKQLEERIIRLLNESSQDTIVKMKSQMSERLQEAASYSNHLTNVISGINHEVSPWLGNTLNILARLKTVLPHNCDKCKTIEHKIDSSINSIEQAVQILSTLSSNVKQLKNHSQTFCSIKSTIESWVKVTLLDRYVKEMIHEDNIKVDAKSLDFNATHSPMFLAQIIFNLVKNSIDHNQDMLNDLQVHIYGEPETKTLIYEDNGKGIPDEIQRNLFKAGVTTKGDGEVHQHGLGLSACMDYCIIMDSVIVCKSIPGKTQFFITFGSSYERLPSGEWGDIKENYRDRVQVKEFHKEMESGAYGTIRDLPDLPEGY